MSMEIAVFAFKLSGTNLFWNRTHKKFLPLSQNTLFVKNHSQVRRLLESKGTFRENKVEYVKMKIVEV